MERLTERLGDYTNPKEICAVWVKNHDYVSAAHRLADYEDIADTVGGFDRLRELAEADKDGRVVVLPAKTVFELTWDAGPDCDLNCPVSVDGEGCCSFCDKGELCIYERKCRQEHIEEIGKTVFFTHEEAMKALEAMKK